MGLGGFSMSQLIIILFIVMLLFGTKKLRSTGVDLGAALRNFKQSMKVNSAD
jgi:sec-independent protein translocase protein TatA